MLQNMSEKLLSHLKDNILPEFIDEKDLKNEDIENFIRLMLILFEMENFRFLLTQKYFQLYIVL
jgi:hypothetical protein